MKYELVIDLPRFDWDDVETPKTRTSMAHPPVTSPIREACIQLDLRTTKISWMKESPGGMGLGLNLFVFMASDLKNNTTRKESWTAATLSARCA